MNHVVPAETREEVRRRGYGAGRERAAERGPVGQGARGVGRRPRGRGRRPDAPMTALVTLLDVPAEGSGAALLDGRHHAAVRRREGGPDLGPEGIAVAAEHLRHGKRGARHDRSSVDDLGAFWDGPWEQIQRTRGRADRGGRDPQVLRRGRQTPMPEQELDGAQVGAGLKQMDGERMAQGVNTLLITRN